jgi:hypothetical protein
VPAKPGIRLRTKSLIERARLRSRTAIRWLAGADPGKLPLAIDPAGYPYIGYNGSGYDALFVEAKATGANVLPANEWTHLLAPMTHTNNMLKRYKNGDWSPRRPSGEDPSTDGYRAIRGGARAPFVSGAKTITPTVG